MNTLLLSLASLLALAFPLATHGAPVTTRAVVADQSSEGQQLFDLWKVKNEEYQSDPDNNLSAKHEALAALKRSAELDHPDGLYMWAMQLNWPNVLEVNPELAAEKVRLLKRAIHFGNVDANVNLGIAYNHGEGVKRDPGMYAHLQCVAARAGNRSAIANLEFSKSTRSGDFGRVVLNSHLKFHARPDFKPGGISFIPKGREIWEVARYNDGWTTVYIEDGCIVGFVRASELSAAQKVE